MLARNFPWNDCTLFTKSLVVHEGCCNKIPRPERHKQLTIIWRLEVHVEGANSPGVC